MAPRRAPRGPRPRATGTARQLEGGRTITTTSLEYRDFSNAGLSRPPPNFGLSKGLKVAGTQPCPWQRGISYH